MILSTECVCLTESRCTGSNNAHSQLIIGTTMEYTRAKFSLGQGNPWIRCKGAGFVCIVLNCCLSTYPDLLCWSHTKPPSHKKEHSCLYHHFQIKTPIVSYLSDRRRVRGDLASYGECCGPPSEFDKWKLLQHVAIGLTEIRSQRRHCIAQG
ncbi:hypothetical protein CPB86DRAFT_383714 [Serendipita vermifera]|nr:hypothetical protein CPB86DRAFT_383714 [Serendipita vermifera]